MMRATQVLSVLIVALIFAVSGCGPADENGGSDWEQPDFFDEVEGDVGVFGEAVDPDPGMGTAFRQEEGHWVEFCYADEGCEDRRGDDEMIHGTAAESLIYASDPDQDVVGVKVNVKVEDNAAADGAVFVAEGTHDPEESLSSDQFDIEQRLHETDVYEPGDVIEVRLGREE